MLQKCIETINKCNGDYKSDFYLKKTDLACFHSVVKNLIDYSLVKKSTTFYGNRRFIHVLTRTLCPFLS